MLQTTEEEELKFNSARVWPTLFGRQGVVRKDERPDMIVARLGHTSLPLSLSLPLSISIAKTVNPVGHALPPWECGKKGQREIGFALKKTTRMLGFLGRMYPPSLSYHLLQQLLNTPFQKPTNLVLALQICFHRVEQNKWH